MTSLYAHNFTLLARPPRSVFSLGDEATRATLPDFQDVAGLRTFVDRLHVYRLDNIPGFFVQMKVGASFVCLLLVLIMLIVGRRAYDKSFWLLRIMTRESGRIVVPNAMLAFSSIQGAFAAVFIAFVWLFCLWFESRSSLPSNPILWLALTWLPLVTGALWAAIGTYWAKPSKSIRERDRSALQRFFSHAWTINACGLLSPVFIAGSVLGPAIISNRGYMRSLGAAQEWQARYAAETDFTQDMAQDAQRIWFQTIEAMRLASVFYIIWTVWALLVCAFYSTASVRLVLSLRSELQKRQKAPVRMFGIVTTHIYSSDERGGGGGNDGAANAAADVTPEQRAASQQKADELQREEKSESGEGRSDAAAATPQVRHAGPTKDAAAAAAAAAIRQQHRLSAISATSIASGRRRHRWLPNIFMQNPDAAVVAGATASRSKQMRELRKAFIHICIQFAAISPACAVMAGIALYLAVNMYGSMEQPSASGGNGLERTLSVALVAVVWTICLFGAITLTAIAQRTYEGVFAGGVQFLSSSGGGGNTSGSHSNATVGEGGRSRNLPRRLSMGIGRVLGSPRTGTRQSNGGGGDHHIMSTFFETRTRAGQQTTPSNGSVHSSQMPLSPPRGKGASDDDVERGGMDGDDEDELDVARNGLFIEHTVVSSIKQVDQQKDGGGGAAPSLPAVGWNQDPLSRRDSQATTLFSHSPAINNGFSAGAATLSPPPTSRSRLTSFASTSAEERMHAPDDGSDDDDEYFRGGTGRARFASRRHGGGGGSQTRR